MMEGRERRCFGFDLRIVRERERRRGEKFLDCVCLVSKRCVGGRWEDGTTVSGEVSGGGKERLIVERTTKEIIQKSKFNTNKSLFHLYYIVASSPFPSPPSIHGPYTPRRRLL
jgi:hypothetical protein